MVSQMTQAKPQPAADMPVTVRNGGISATTRASKRLRDMKAQYGSLRAVSDELAKRGYPVNKGYISNVINLKRHANPQLLIALGIKKPRPVPTPEQRQARKDRRASARALIDGLMPFAMAGRRTEINCLSGEWFVSIHSASGMAPPAMGQAGTLAEAVRIASDLASSDPRQNDPTYMAGLKAAYGLP